MKLLFQRPYVERVYPCPTAGCETMIHVKEILLTEHPMKFVEQHYMAISQNGGSIFATDIRGTRSWRVEEFNSGSQQNENPWQELWYIPQSNTPIVLDILMYTQFYSDQTIDRYYDFRKITQELDESFGVIIKQAGMGGVAMCLKESPEPDRWESTVERMYEFNKHYFSADESKESISNRYRGSLTLFFGYT